MTEARAQPTARVVLAWLTRRPDAQAWTLLTPGTLWLALFFAIPVLIMCAYSLMPRGEYGGVEPGITGEAYARFFNPVYLIILERTFVVALACTRALRAAGISGGLRDRAQRPLEEPAALSRGAAVLDQLSRAYLRDDLSHARYRADQQLADAAGRGARADHHAVHPFAVLTGLVYGYLPFMILPVYASLEKLDLSLLEAAEILGARPAARFRRVTLPLSTPGLVAGCLLVFIPALGSFLTSDLLGGAKEMLIGNLVQNQFSTARIGRSGRPPRRW